MKKKLILFLIVLNSFVYSQNVGINTSGAAPAATNFLEILSPSTLANSAAIYASHDGAITGTGYAIQVSKTGASTTNVAGDFTASGATTNVAMNATVVGGTSATAGVFSATGATTNYAIIIPANSGKVGIGTSSPTADLEVVSTASTTNAQTLTTNSLTSGIGLSIIANALTSGSGLSINSSTTTLTGDLVKMEATGNNSSITGSVLKIGMTQASAAGVPLNVTNGGTGLSLKINDDGTYSDATPFVVDASGNVGIGISAPASKLQIAAGTTTVAPIRLTSGTLMTTPVAGAIEFDGSEFYFTISSVRYIIPMALRGSATLDFANTAAGSSTDLTITVMGAADGDPVFLGVPNGSGSSNGCFTAWVSGANTVTVRFTNNSLLSALNPASGLFKVTVHK